MSKAINAIEEFSPALSINRDALMLDELTVFQQWEGWTPSGGGEGGGGKRLRTGEFLRDAGGSWFRVYDIGGGKLRLAPVAQPGDLFPTAPKSQWKTPAGAFENELGQLVQTDLQGNITTSRTIPWSEWAGGGGGTGSTGRTQFPSERALDTAQAERLREQSRIEREQLQHTIAQDEADLAWAKEEFARAQAAEDRRAMEYAKLQMDMLEMRLENDKRTLLYSEYGATARTKMQQQQSAREMAFQTRDDPFSFAQAVSAGPMLGGTPAQAFRQNLTSFANAPIPGLSINAPIPVMEQALRQMGGMQMPMPGPYVGMAGGGIIEMEKRDGAFNIKPATEQTVLVGDGAGIIPGVTEALTVGTNDQGAFSVKVTPIVGGAAAGATVNPEAMKALLAPLFADISPGGYPLAGYGQRAEWLGRFGYQPAMARVGDSYYLRTPEGGYRAISPYYITGAGAGPTTPTAASAVPMRNIGELEQLGPIGSGLSSAELPDFLSRFLEPQPAGAFGPMSSLIMEPTTGIMMPAPYQVAQELTRLQYENPTAFEGIMSAYANSYIGGQPGGFSRQAVLGQMGATRPGAGAFGRRIGFTGGYL